VKVLNYKKVLTKWSLPNGIKNSVRLNYRIKGIRFS